MTRRTSARRDRPRPTTPREPKRTSPSWAAWTLLLAALLVFTALIYQPAWHGTLVWDDPAHVTRPELRSPGGLSRIWLEPGATQQYYPLTHSAFWVQAWLWGDATTGYHVVNIALHATAAWLLALLLMRLGVPGAVLAAVLFAAHPVHVESVAWISELKNTLSAVFFLGAALVYLRWDGDRQMRLYVAAALLFVCALLAKTVTATLPAALLVVFWWRRGTLSWPRDVRPLLPFFAVGVAAAAMTAWMERVHIGAKGVEFALSPMDRVLVAGRAFWFYLSKLLWPSDLMFVYPRWEIDARAAWQWAFPIAAMLVVAGAWFVRRRSRAPLAVLLLFAGLLFPALGFVNVFPFRYSFVADHFQYHASMSVIAAAAAGIVLLLRRWTGSRGAVAAPMLLVALLALLAWRQAHDYVSAEALYRATLARNPDAWLAHNNLARILIDSGRVAQARSHLEAAVRLNPRIPEHHANLGRLELQDGRIDAALASFDRALALAANLPNVHSDRGVALLRRGDIIGALHAFDRALALAPDHPEALRNSADAYTERGIARMRRGERAAAIGDFEQAVRRRPDDSGAAAMLAQAHHEHAIALHQSGRRAEALEQFSAAARLAPDDPALRNDAGVALLEAGRIAEAVAEFEAALRLRPDFAAPRLNLERARQQR